MAIRRSPGFAGVFSNEKLRRWSATAHWQRPQSVLCLQWPVDMNNHREFFDATQSEVPVRGFLHGPTNSVGDCLVLTHGAGSNCDSPLLVAMANAFSASGLTVLRCDLPFRQLRSHGPPQRGSAERDQQGLRAA